ncbi:MAG: DegT/DnrJ/EryC1/StrS family aminotransferase [Candidatus Nanoarchaeia archaeon]|nr:DegT/DnrJ/EryC1/StrS family aminotransferase [Candidatus Nanoarchaeia archaeon]
MRRIFVGDLQIKEEERNAVNEVLDSQRISEHKKVKEFEEKFAEYIGTKYCTSFNSGTSAMIAGLESLKYHPDLKIKEKSKIITTPLTYIATVNSVMKANFNPVFVDVHKETFDIKADEIKKLLEEEKNPEEYSLILPVHLMGYPADMDKINKIAKEFNLHVFEDSAQAHGTLYNGKKTGSMSLMSDFSFYIAHNIQAGEFGALVTNDKQISILTKKIKANGRLCSCDVCTRGEGKCPHQNNNSDIDYDPRFIHDIIGYNFKTMEFQAALALTQLKKADYIFKKRQQNVKYLNENLKEFEEKGILKLPKFSTDVSYLAYPIVIQDPFKISRKNLRKRLELKGVETRPLFYSIPTQQPAYSFLKQRYLNKLPNADYLGLNAFYIGCHQYLEKEDLDYVIKIFNEILK